MFEIHAFCPLIRYCDETDTSDHALNCSSENSKKLVECQGQIQLCEDKNGVFVKVNISINDDWYIICQYYTPVDIGKKSSITHTTPLEVY